MATDSEVLKSVSRRSDQQEILADMREDAELAKSEGTWTVRDLSEKLGIPPGFILTINGKPYVTKEGLLQKARLIGFDSIRAELEELRDEGGRTVGWAATAEVTRSLSKDEFALLSSMTSHVDKDTFLQVYRDLHKATVAHGTATRENVANPAMGKWMRELAETRAINRALRLFTGCGLVTPEELEDVRNGTSPGVSA